MDTAPAQVKVIFTTNEPDLALPEEKRQLLVPAGMFLMRSIIPQSKSC